MLHFHKGPRLMWFRRISGGFGSLMEPHAQHTRLLTVYNATSFQGWKALTVSFYIDFRSVCARDLVRVKSLHLVWGRFFWVRRICINVYRCSWGAVCAQAKHYGIQTPEIYRNATRNYNFFFVKFLLYSCSWNGSVLWFHFIAYCFGRFYTSMSTISA